MDQPVAILQHVRVKWIAVIQQNPLKLATQLKVELNFLIGKLTEG
jgi:hypothetical protein